MRMPLLSALALLIMTPAVAVGGTITGKVTIMDVDGRVDRKAEAVVYMIGPPQDKALPPQTAKILQLGHNDTNDLRFDPDAIAITVGDSVAFPNFSKILHNVYSRSPNGSFDLGSFKPGESKAWAFKKTGVFEIYCNIHPMMAATIIVVPNRHHVRTKNGSFRLDGVPVGEWTLYAYTRRAPKPTIAKIKVPPGGVTANLSILRGAPAH